MHFHNMTYMATPEHKNPCPGGHYIKNFGRPFLGYQYYILELSDPCPSVDKKRSRNIAFSLYGHAPAQEHLPGGVKQFTILVDPSFIIITI